MNNFETIRPFIFIVLFVLFVSLEFIIPKRKRSLSKRNTTNVIIFIAGIALLRIIFPLGLAVAAYHFRENQMGLVKLFELPIIVQTIITCIIFDFFIYWQHRFSHTIPFFWRFHRIHHSDTEMDISTGIRFHPGEILMSGVYKIALIFIFTPSVTAYLIYETLLSGFALFNHSNIKVTKRLDKWLRILLATPDFHTPHHSPVKRRTNSNFGNVLSIWDYLFKTYDSEENAEFGLDNESSEDSRSLPHLLTGPFGKN